MAKDSGPKGQQAEALRSLKSAARSGSRKPDGQGYEARGDTAPKPAAPERKQRAAAEVLKGRRREAAGQDARSREEGAEAVARRCDGASRGAVTPAGP